MARHIRFLAVAAAVCSLLAVTTAPARAGESCSGSASTAPDGKIRIGTGPFIGAGQYPITFANADLDQGEKVKFGLKWKNVSASTRTIRVALASEITNVGWIVRYLVNGVNVTEATDGGKSLKFAGVLAGKSTPPLEVVVKNKAGAPVSGAERSFQGRYGGTEPLVCDVLVVNAHT